MKYMYLQNVEYTL